MRLLPMTFLRKVAWNAATLAGTRRVGHAARSLLPSYRDTVFYFDLFVRDGIPAGLRVDDERSRRLVALTIDDGLSRGGSRTSLVPEVRALLRRHDARATFFVCTDYCAADGGVEASARELVEADGHEVGNHLESDGPLGYYARLPREEFAAALDRANAFLDSIDGGVGVRDGHRRRRWRWFRAPQGVYTASMREEIQSRPGMIHALGDCYCDDWAMSDDSDYVANTMLRQVRHGSVAILHMPEKGFRESCLDALEKFLAGLDAKGYRCVTLSEMQWLQEESRRAEEERSTSSGS